MHAQTITEKLVINFMEDIHQMSLRQGIPQSRDEVMAQSFELWPAVKERLSPFSSKYGAEVVAGVKSPDPALLSQQPDSQLLKNWQSVKASDGNTYYTNRQLIDLTTVEPDSAKRNMAQGMEPINPDSFSQTAFGQRWKAATLEAVAIQSIPESQKSTAGDHTYVTLASKDTNAAILVRLENYQYFASKYDSITLRSNSNDGMVQVLSDGKAVGLITAATQKGLVKDLGALQAIHDAKQECLQTLLERSIAPEAKAQVNESLQQMQHSVENHNHEEALEQSQTMLAPALGLSVAHQFPTASVDQYIQHLKARLKTATNETQVEQMLAQERADLDVQDRDENITSKAEIWAYINDYFKYDPSPDALCFLICAALDRLKIKEATAALDKHADVDNALDTLEQVIDSGIDPSQQAQQALKAFEQKLDDMESAVSAPVSFAAHKRNGLSASLNDLEAAVSVDAPEPLPSHETTIADAVASNGELSYHEAFDGMDDDFDAPAPASNASLIDGARFDATTKAALVSPLFVAQNVKESISNLKPEYLMENGKLDAHWIESVQEQFLRIQSKINVSSLSLQERSEVAGVLNEAMQEFAGLVEKAAVLEVPTSKQILEQQKSIALEQGQPERKKTAEKERGHYALTPSM